jgi:hypothetical protein
MRRGFSGKTTVLQGKLHPLYDVVLVYFKSFRNYLEQIWHHGARKTLREFLRAGERTPA